MSLTQEEFQKIAELLIPFCKDVPERWALVNSAFPGEKLVAQVEYAGSASTFAANLIQQSLSYGNIATGEPPLAALLREIRNRSGKNREAQIDAIVGRLLQPQGVTDKRRTVNRIFLGLQTYGEEDADCFFGREGVAEEIEKRIKNCPFFILKGESGCGKSSLLNVQLLPKLRAQFRVVETRIAEDPVGKTIIALQGSKPSEVSTDRDFHAALPNAKPEYPTILVLDQLEELFVTVKDTERLRFFGLLCEAVKYNYLRLLLTMRSDFSDLLLDLCEAADPNATTFDTGNYYVLRAFDERKAISVLTQMLSPLATNEFQRMEHVLFSRELSSQLLTPPRDKRLSLQDEKSVLPVEMQTIGYVLETGVNGSFTVDSLKKRGGRNGLLNSFVEDAADYVYNQTRRKTSRATAILILSRLVSKEQTKWARTASQISEELNKPQKDIQSALEALCRKYLVNHLPPASDTPNGERRYELMHDHLVQILREAPNETLQNEREAQLRLEFWTNQARAFYNKEGEN